MKKTQRPPLSPSDVTVAELVTYLSGTNWSAVSHPNDRFRVFAGHRDDAGNPIELVLPASDAFEDASKMIESVLRTLSMKEVTTIDDIVGQIKFLTTDRFQKRLLVDDARGISLPLSLACEAIASLRDLLQNAAMQEEEPKQYHERQTQAGADYVEQCRFGHTFRASFGFVVLSPVPTKRAASRAEQSEDLFQEDEKLAPPEIPKTRRIIERLARGLSLVQASVKSNDIAPLIEKVNEGMDGRCLETIVAMIERVGPVDIEYSLAWSPELALSPEVRKFEPVRLGMEALPPLKEAVQELKPKGDKPRPEMVIGRVVDLYSRFAPFEHREEARVIRILWERRGAKDVEVEVRVSAEDFEKAYAAMGKGKRVKVHGTLNHPRGGSYSVSEPGPLEVDQEIFE